MSRFMSWWQAHPAAVAALTVLVLGMVLGLQVQRNTDSINANIRATAALAAQRCRVGNANAAHLDQLIDALVVATRKVGAGTPAELDARVASYRRAKAQQVDCDTGR